MITHEGYASSETSLSHLDESTKQHRAASGARRTRRTNTDARLEAVGLPPAKSFKRRASKACLSCRSRKVRCDAFEHGCPCTNCRLDELECVVIPRKRPSKKPLLSCVGTASRPAMNSQPGRSQRQSTPKQAQGPVAEDVDMKIKTHWVHVPHALYRNLLENRPGQQREQTPMLTDDNNVCPYPIFQDERTIRAPIVPSIETSMPPLHPFNKPLPLNVDCDSIRYLERAGALAIPAQPLRDELLRHFAEFVHPSMPLLDVHELIASIDGEDGKSPVSLLLFQAIMFSGAATVDTHFLEAAEYATRREARARLFRKVRLLYDFDTETDRVTLIQSLLLMTLWNETPDDPKGGHHWMGIAVSLCYATGLHHDPDERMMNESTRKLRKRLWWSTLMRDRIMAFEMRRPTYIQNGHFSVPMLTVSDLKSHVVRRFSPADTLAGCQILRDVDLQAQLALVCVAGAKLCECIGSVLSTQYPFIKKTPGAPVEEADGAHDEAVRDCDRALRQWKNELPSDLARWDVPSHGNRSIVLHRCLLHMIYYMTLSALHRPALLYSRGSHPRHSVQANFIESSRQVVLHTADKITRIAYQLQSFGMVGYLPTTGVTVLLPALIGHLLEIRGSKDSATKAASVDGFRQCVVIMHELQSTYAAADHALHGLGSAICQAGMFMTMSDGLSTFVEIGHSMPTPDSAAPETYISSVTREGSFCEPSVSAYGGDDAHLDELMHVEADLEISASSTP